MWDATKDIDESGITNLGRANRAKQALDIYQSEKIETPTLAEPIDAVDLIADLMHYLASVGQDPYRALETATGHFDAER